MSELARDFSAWVGRTDTVHDGMSAEHARGAAAMFDDDVDGIDSGTPLPPLWHWFYFLPRAAQSQLDVDGHPQRGGFLPPIPYPRRMFAGARLRFHAPLTLGIPATRDGEIRNVVMKSGRSGWLAFVTVGYRVSQRGVLCIDEAQDIVYLELGAPVPAPQILDAPIAPERGWTRTVTPDARLLFRFSTLTFNAHRIHYDRPYALNEEGYPGLVVHGPLTAMLLADLVRRNTTAAIKRFSFRGIAPLFDFAPFHLIGRPDGATISLDALGSDHARALTALAEL